MCNPDPTASISVRKSIGRRGEGHLPLLFLATSFWLWAGARGRDHLTSTRQLPLTDRAHGTAVSLLYGTVCMDDEYVRYWRRLCVCAHVCVWLCWVTTAHSWRGCSCKGPDLSPLCCAPGNARATRRASSGTDGADYSRKLTHIIVLASYIWVPHYQKIQSETHIYLQVQCNKLVCS